MPAISANESRRAKREHRVLLCLVPPGNAGRDGNMQQNDGFPKPAFSFGTIQPL